MHYKCSILTMGDGLMLGVNLFGKFDSSDMDT